MTTTTIEAEYDSMLEFLQDQWEAEPPENKAMYLDAIMVHMLLSPKEFGEIQSLRNSTK